MTNVHNTLKTARKALDGLRTEHGRVGARLAEIAVERERIAPAALSGDQGAAAKLDVLKAEKASLSEHGEDVNSAIRQAERDVEAAQIAVSAHNSRETAQHWLVQADQLEAAGRAAQNSVEAFVAAIGKVSETAAALRASGGMTSSDHHMGIMLRQAVQSHLIGAGLAEATVPIGNRRQLTDLIGEYAAGIRAGANRKIAAADSTVGTSNERAAA